MQSSYLALLFGNMLTAAKDYIGYLLFAFIGSLFKEIYNTNTKKGYFFSPTNVVISTVFGSVTALAAKSHWFPNENWEFIAFLSLACGALGFEIFILVANLENVTKLIKVITNFNKALEGKPVDAKEDDESDKKADDHKSQTPNDNKCKEPDQCKDQKFYVDPYSVIESKIHRSNIPMRVHDPRKK